MRKKTILQKHKDNEINNYEVNEYYKIIIVSINKEIINLVNICDRRDTTPLQLSSRACATCVT